MEIMDLEHLRYPIGKYNPPKNISDSDRKRYQDKIASLPTDLRNIVLEVQHVGKLDTPYRLGGWTGRQVIHHLADSHINAYTRFKLALTEDNPTIKPYEEQLWAELTDGKTAEVDFSIMMLEGLHARWHVLLNHMTETDFARTLYHPANDRTSTLEWMLGLYAWHCEHHLAHLKLLLTK